MSRYLASCRTNYVKIRHLDEVRTSLPVTYEIRSAPDDSGKVAIVSAGAGGAFWPGVGAEGQSETISLTELVAPHLADGEVLVVIEVGVGEGLEYLIGFADAADNTGRRIRVDLNNIYELAASGFPEDSSPIGRAEF